MDSSGDMTYIVNYDRISNQAATLHFYAPVCRPQVVQPNEAVQLLLSSSCRRS
jgi:hypothetical protein